MRDVISGLVAAIAFTQLPVIQQQCFRVFGQVIVAVAGLGDQVHTLAIPVDHLEGEMDIVRHLDHGRTVRLDRAIGKNVVQPPVSGPQYRA